MKEKDTVPVPLKPGDTVYCEGSSAIHGTVLWATDDGWHIRWHEALTTEIREDLVLVKVNNDQNEKRRALGHQAVVLHPDFTYGGACDDEYFTHASDMIANVIHAACDHRQGDEYSTPRELVEKALRCWEGDAEDNYVEPAGDEEWVKPVLVPAVPAPDSGLAGSAYPEPPDYLTDAWRRYQSGESQVSDSELRQIDEWRADVHYDAYQAGGYTHAELEQKLAEARLPYAKKIKELEARLAGPVYIVMDEAGDIELMDEKPTWNWQPAGFTVLVGHINGGDSLVIQPDKKGDTMTYDEIAQAIVNGQVDDRLQDISKVIHLRFKTLDDLKSLNFKKDDRVVFNDRSGTQYLRGVGGTVTTVNSRSKKVNVLVDDVPKAQRRAGVELVCPAAIIDLEVNDG